MARALSMLRPEIVSLAILIFIQVYAYAYKKATAKIFQCGCWAAISHVLLDILTVLTVNDVISVPIFVNDMFHFTFYISALIFCIIYLDYIAAQVMTDSARARLSKICLWGVGIYVLSSPFMAITYTDDVITNYSGGSACMIVMGTAFLYFTLGILMLIRWHKKIERYVYVTILSTTLFMMVCVVVQLLIPTFLFTGCGITMATVGMFFAIENPVKYYQQRAFIDIGTGVKNKNCFYEDMKILNKKREAQTRMKLTIVVSDLNWLKYTNDIFGHLAGDEIIKQAGELLTKYFHHEYSVYRFGGDEFLVLFVDKDDTQVQSEIDIIYKKCKEKDMLTIYPFSLALGYATTDEIDDFDIQKVIMLADKRMYEAKTVIKEAHPEYNVRTD